MENGNVTLYRKSAGRRFLKEHKTEFNMLIIFAVLFIILSFSSEYFFTSQNIKNVMSQISSNSMLAIGMTVVIITSGIDLSVGANLGFSGMIGCMVLMKRKMYFWELQSRFWFQPLLERSMAF